LLAVVAVEAMAFHIQQAVQAVAVLVEMVATQVQA
jgi:hypothetical protein